LARRPAILTDFFRGFHKSLQNMPAYYLKLGHRRYLPNSFQFIIHISSFHCTLYSRSYGESVVK